MRMQAVQVKSAVGRLLCDPIFQPSGKKLMAKGHQISEEDIRILNLEGHDQVRVAVLEEGEVPEDEAGLRIASEAACGAMEVRLSAGGRANLFATENSCLLLDENVLREINQSGCVSVATMPNLSLHRARAAPGKRQKHSFRRTQEKFRAHTAAGEEQGPRPASPPHSEPYGRRAVQRSPSGGPCLATL